MKLRATHYGFTIFSCILLSTFSGRIEAQISQKNIVVYQVGDGINYGTNTATPAFIMEYNRDTIGQASPVHAITIPTTGSARLVNSYSTNSDGFINLSNDSTRIVMAGYDTTTTTIGITSSSSSLIPRVVDTISWRGIPGRAATTSSFSGQAFQSATAGNGDDYWGCGASNGVVYLGNTATTATVSSTIASIRVLSSSNGNLYFSTGSGTVGIYKFSGLPTASATPSLLIATGTGSSPYAFSVNAGETVVYCADDRSTGGIFRWTLSGTTWTATDSLKPGSAAARGIAVDWSGAYPVVFATTTDNKLIKWIDSNNASHIYTVLATAGTNKFFRSVALAPKSPCNLTASVSFFGTGNTCVGDSILLSANTGTGVSYQWSRNNVRLTNDTLQTYKVGVSGIYTVTISNAIKCSATSPFQRIYINPKPDTSLTFSTSKPLCTGDTLVVCAQNLPYLVYQWKRNGSLTTVATPCDTIGVGGSYQLFITDTANHCTDSSNAFTVTAYTTPSAALVPAGRMPLCNGTTLKLHTNNAANLSYVWTKNDTTISGSTDSTLVAALAGIYKVRVQLNGTSCADSAADTLIVVPMPNISITKLSKDTVCEGDTIRVRAGAGPSYQFQWVIGGFGSSSLSLDSNFIIVAPSVPGITTAPYKLFVTSGFGCVDSSATQYQTIIPLPIPLINYIVGTLTAGAFNTYQWYLNGSIIPGATNATFVPTANGDYTVHVTNAEGCSATSDPYTVTGLSVNDALLNAGISIYPNPVKGLLKIEANYPLNVVLTDMSGRELLQKQNAKSIEMGSFAQGVYLLKVYRENGVFMGSKLVTKVGE
ncbi:MAG: T9SS type A sorting domain-containing protein [Chitinophagaceae bacterium]